MAHLVKHDFFDGRSQTVCKTLNFIVNPWTGCLVFVLKLLEGCKAIFFRMNVPRGEKFQKLLVRGLQDFGLPATDLIGCALQGDMLEEPFTNNLLLGHTAISLSLSNGGCLNV